MKKVLLLFSVFVLGGCDATGLCKNIETGEIEKFMAPGTSINCHRVQWGGTWVSPTVEEKREYYNKRTKDMMDKYDNYLLKEDKWINVASNESDNPAPWIIKWINVVFNESDNPAPWIIISEKIPICGNNYYIAKSADERLPTWRIFLTDNFNMEDGDVRFNKGFILENIEIRQLGSFNQQASFISLVDLLEYIDLWREVDMEKVEGNGVQRWTAKRRSAKAGPVSGP
jgi:hypothetical protein